MKRCVIVALALAAVSCARDPALPDPALPERILPARIDGFTVRPEPSAEDAFKTSHDISLVADGRLFTMRKGGTVHAALQIATLKRGYDTEEDEVRRGIRASIEQGRYRWFKIAGQWVGEQRLPEIGLYLWMPPSGTLYEVLVMKPELGIPKRLLEKIITYQRGAV